MRKTKRISIDSLAKELGDKTCKQVFCDEFFQRQTLVTNPETDMSVSIILDTLKDSSINCYHISITLPESQTLEFDFGQADHAMHDQGRLITPDTDDKLFWIPCDPVTRKYDDKGRIEHQQKSDVEIKSDSNSFCFSINTNGEGFVEFCILEFTKNGGSFAKQICEPDLLETKKVIRSNWFYYAGLSDIWKYFINGKVFNTEPLPERKGGESQNITFALYYYLYYLHSQTQKPIYMKLCDLIAYSLMLSLPQDSRFRHGSWTELMETHTVYQVSAIDVLLSFFEKTRRSIFLEKAKCAMDDLISLTEELDDGSTWFMHDTLEGDLKDARLYYEKMTVSEAFGKSKANTLCFNSHIWTLMALYHLNKLAPSDEYQRLFESGMTALKRVLQARPCSFLYYAIYRLWDALVSLDLKYKNRLTRKMLKVYKILMSRYILPKLKKLFPRLVMPNGFLERDLNHTVMSLNYHFLNIKDLLMLYGQTHEKWIKDIILKSVSYTLRSDIVEYFGFNNPRSLKVFDILLSYSSLIDQQGLNDLKSYISIFRKNDFPLTMDVVSNPFIADISLKLNVSDSDIEVLIPACNELITAVMINPTMEDKKVFLNTDIDSNEFEFVDSEERKHIFKNEIIIPASGYVKIVKKTSDHR